MKPQELRFGNYCFDAGERIIQILDIGELEINCFEKGGDLSPQNEFQYPICSISPIPLTNDWLKSFGFICVWSAQGDGTTWEKKWKGDCKIQLHGDHKLLHLANHEISWIFMPEINYVHELQNLYYSLTREELIIKE